MEAFTLILGGVAGLAVGIILTYLWADRKHRIAISALETARALAEQRQSDLALDLENHRSETEKARGDLEVVRVESSLKAAHAAALAAELAASNRNVTEQRALLDDANTRLTQAFAAVSREALERSNASFLQMAQERFKSLSAEAAGSLDERKAQIGTLLKPLEETLAAYQKRLAELEQQRTDAYASLRQQIGTMHATEAALSKQTTQLISALTRPSVRGQWGEIALRRLVELAGMTARCDFTEQVLLAGDEGRLRPDMVVHLPADRSVVVDCKAVLGAFLEAAAATDEAARQAHLKKHASLVRGRAKELAGKAYWSQFDAIPEFVVLFLPGESFLYAACEQDPTLLEDCLATRVIIATPTTLIALLKSIEYGWRQQILSQNAQEIRRLGTEVYERLATLAENMAKLGDSLGNSVDLFNKTVGGLESRLLVSARKMGELGARNDKEVPELPPIEKQVRELTTSLFPD